MLPDVGLNKFRINHFCAYMKSELIEIKSISRSLSSHRQAVKRNCSNLKYVMSENNFLSVLSCVKRLFNRAFKKKKSRL